MRPLVLTILPVVLGIFSAEQVTSSSQSFKDSQLHSPGKQLEAPHPLPARVCGEDKSAVRRNQPATDYTGSLVLHGHANRVIFTKTQLAYLHACVTVLAHLSGLRPAAKIKALQTIIHVLPYSTADLTTLDFALVQYQKAKSHQSTLITLDSEIIDVLIRAEIDTRWLTKADIYCLRAFIELLKRADAASLDTESKREVLSWCSSLAPCSTSQTKQMLATTNQSLWAEDITTLANPFTQGIPSVCPYTEIPLSLKINLKLTIEGLAAHSCIVGARLRGLLSLCDVWVNGDLGLTATFGAKGHVDAAILAHIMLSLKQFGYEDVANTWKVDFTGGDAALR